MFREWSIADGPAELTDKDINTVCVFILASGERFPVMLTKIGPMHGNDVHSFSGTYTNGQTYTVHGTFNFRTHVGGCHALIPDD